MRLENKAALVFGGGQLAGRTIGNGRATCLAYAREGARVFCVDVNMDAARDTVGQITEEGGRAVALQADITDEQSVLDAVRTCYRTAGAIDILHNNVGVSIAGGDATITDITVEAFDRVIAVNLRGMVLTIKHVLPAMRHQRSGAIINISSTAARDGNYPYIGYKTSKAAVVSLTEYVAARNAEHGVRCNVILPGLINTPMAIEHRVKKFGMSYEDVIAQRDQQVPLGRKMGTAWDIANAAVFLASDEASFITGVALPVDGGQSVVGRLPSRAEAAEELAAADAAAQALAAWD
jgi:NAD(P)-dependent dehydrogenase (short-subunit alcohol dehydrogenase family)